MPKSSTTLKSGDNLPARGKSNKTRILDAIRSESVMELAGLTGKPTRDQAEEAYFSHIARRAFTATDPNSAMLLKVLGDKGWANLKPTLDPIELDFPIEGTATQKSMAVVNAIATGKIAPDIGQMIIGIIKDSVIIEEGTDLKARIEQLEEIINK